MWRAVLVGLSLATTMIACGGTDTGGDPVYPYPSESSFCEALGDVECNSAVVKACYGSDQTTLAEDTQSCAAARAEQCNPEGLPYHPEHAEACLNARKQALEDAVWTHQDLESVESACLPVFSKEGPDGAVCSSNADCDSLSKLRCVVKLGAIEGVCAVPVTKSGGEDCAAPEAVCGEGFYCDPQVSHCLANPTVDEACSAQAPCDAGSYCTSLDDGVCVAKTKNGLDCAKDELCSGGFCVGATDMKMGVCSSTLPLQLNAESCADYRE